MKEYKIEYKKTKTVLGDNWHVFIDGQWMFYPFSADEDFEELKAFVDIYKEEIVKKRYSNENLGLGFYICGYNGEAQNRLCDKWSARGVHVF